MTKIYGLFNASSGDREYLDNYVNAAVGALAQRPGVVPGIGNALEPEISPSLDVEVNTGFAFAGTPLGGWWIYSDAVETLSHDAAGAGNSRIDTIIVKVDRNIATRTVDIEILKGTDTTGTPTAPSLTQTETVYEMPVCDVYITESAITAINDRRAMTGDRSISQLVVSDADPGDFIYPVVTSGIEVWSVDSADQVLGQAIYDGFRAVRYGLMSMPSALIATLTDEMIDGRKSLYVQSDGSIGIATSAVHAGFIVNSTEMFVDLNPKNENPYEYSGTLTNLKAMPGSYHTTYNTRFGYTLPADATALMLRYKTEAQGPWTSGDDHTTGTQVSADLGTTDYDDPNEWNELEIPGAAAGDFCYFKFFPIKSGLYNETIGENEIASTVGTLMLEYLAKNISGGNVTDSSGNSNTASLISVSQNSGGGKIEDSFVGAGAGQILLTTAFAVSGKSIVVGVKPSNASSGIYGVKPSTSSRSTFGRVEADNDYVLGGDFTGHTYTNAATAWQMLIAEYSAGPSLDAWLNNVKILTAQNGGALTNIESFGTCRDFIGSVGHTYYLNGELCQIRVFSQALETDDRDNLYNGGDWV